MFSDKVRRLRAENKLSQRAFAERIGVSPTTIVSYEKGGKVPAYEVLVNICREFGVSLDWLCDISENATTKKTTAGDIARTIIRLFDFCDNIDIFDTSEGVHVDIPNVQDDLRVFLDKFGKMLSLSIDETIDKDTFDLWVQRKLNALDNILIK